MVDESIVKSVQRYLVAVIESGIPVSFGVVYGSQATGRTHKWSDIDLIVVSPIFDEEYDRTEIFKLWRIAARTDSRIEPLPCGEKQWIDDTERAIIEIARREGVRVNVPEAQTSAVI